MVLLKLDSHTAGHMGAPIVMEEIDDTGAMHTLMDTAKAHKVGLSIQVARGLEFGTYFGPGSKEKPCAGRILGPVVLQFGRDVTLELKEVKLIHHAEPLLLIEADVLCGGHDRWMYRAMSVGAASKGMIIFANGKHTMLLPLVNTPILGCLGFMSAAATMTAPPPAPVPMSCTVSEPTTVDTDCIDFLHTLAEVCWGRCV